MTTNRTINSRRRTFLKAAGLAGAGLTLAFRIDVAEGAQSSASAAGKENAAGAALQPNAFVRIGTDNTVTVIAKHLEMGQGTYTGLATILADELGAAWSQVRVESAPADNERYKNLLIGMQLTGGSTAIANSWEQLRNAGATARAMLVAAAAAQWKVPPDSVLVKDGVVSHASGRKATFGQLATAAASVPVPTKVNLKDPKDFTLIGKTAPRKDSRAKSTGTAQFTQDVKLPEMLTAVIAHPPRFGAKAQSMEAKAVSSIPGVRYVLEVPTGVAVLATSFWAAKKGRDNLRVQWNDGGFKYSSADIFDEYRKLAQNPGSVAKATGDVAKAFSGAAKTLDASYEFPYLAHAAMEPMNCVVRLSSDKVEIWNGDQAQTMDQQAIAKAVGLSPAQVKINTLFAGGSFGRRANIDSDYVLEAVEIAKELARNGKRDVPVKLVWTREDDMRAGYYRPAYYHTLKAALDANGNPVAWQHRIVGQSIMAQSPMMASMMVKDGIDATSVEGAANLPYAVPNLSVDLHSPNVGVPVLWWRSVGSTHNAYATETFIDELAQAAGKDPVAFRRTLLAGHARHLAVLDLATKQSGWGSPLPAGSAGERRGRGIAVHESFNTVVAQVAEVTVRKDNTIKVDRVVCAVDCGIAVNPDIVRVQMEGGIGFGLSAALYGAITLKDGSVEQSNFHDYPVLRIHEMPVVEVHIVPSAADPTGVGEPATPVIAPAVANAIAAATGTRLRKLPLKLA